MASAFDILQRPALPQRGPLARWEAATDEGLRPMETIVRAAWGATTIGELFFAGYQGALEQLLGGGQTKALLVTEATGQHPRQLTTRLEGQRVSGSKAFAMVDVDAWWVLAVAGPRDLRLVRVAPEQPGIQITPFSASFIADVPHGSIVLDGVVADQVVEDAWGRFVKPFRALEDGGVLLALTTALLGATTDADDEDALLGVFAALTQLFGATDDASFRALIGVREQLLVLAGRATLEGPLAEGWSAYEPLVHLARAARLARLERARSRTRFRATRSQAQLD